jgi:hypothetical protein
MKTTEDAEDAEGNHKSNHNHKSKIKNHKLF